MELEFFMPMRPPTTTAQTRAVTVGRDGKPRLYKTAELKAAEAKLTDHLAMHRPAGPMAGPLRLMVKWLFPGDVKGGRGWEWKTTRPDTDNLQKLLKDCMTRLGFWRDDAQVCSEIVEKFVVADRTGIYVSVETLEG